MIGIKRLVNLEFESTKACKAFINIGAGGRNRTDMRLPSRDFETFQVHFISFLQTLVNTFETALSLCLRVIRQEKK